MAILHSYGHEKDGIIHWILEKNEFEFTMTEFLLLTGNIREKPLFSMLDQERPSLKSQLLLLYKDEFSEDIGPEDFEFQVEQALLSLRSSLRI
jgi:hypothetical protein